VDDNLDEEWAEDDEAQGEECLVEEVSHDLVGIHSGVGLLVAHGRGMQRGQLAGIFSDSHLKKEGEKNMRKKKR